MVLWGVTWLPVAPMQVELRGLAPDTILQLLQPEGAQRILRDTAELSALHNVSYQLLAGSPSPQKSEWSWTLWVCTSGCAQLHIPARTCVGHCCWGREGLCPAFLDGDLPTTSSKTSPAFTACSGDGGVGEAARAPSRVQVSAPWDWGDHRCFGLPRPLWGALLGCHLSGVEVPVEMVSWTTETTPPCGRSGPSSWTGAQETIPMQTPWEGAQGNPREAETSTWMVLSRPAAREAEPRQPLLGHGEGRRYLIPVWVHLHEVWSGECFQDVQPYQ